jgi:hypothetical protein
MRHTYSFLDAVGNTTPMSSLYASSPVPSVRQAGNSAPGTVGSFIASHAGTVGVAQLGKPFVYLNASLIDPGAYFQNLAIVLHEVLHNVTGLTDSDLQRLLGLPSQDENGRAVPTDNVTKRLLGDCF